MSSRFPHASIPRTVPDDASVNHRIVTTTRAEELLQMPERRHSARIQSLPEREATKRTHVDSSDSEENDVSDHSSIKWRSKKDRKKPRTQPLGGGKPREKQLASDNSLFRVLQDPDAAIADAIQEWLSKYQTDADGAMAEMVNLILCCCGCTYEVSLDDMRDEDSVVETLSQIQEAFKKSMGEAYMLIQKGPAARGLKRNLHQMIDHLVQQAADTEILYGDLMERYLLWITPMSSSPLRAFRHTSTHILLKVTSSLTRIYSNITELLAKTNQQIAKEQERPKTSASKVKSLQNTLKVSEEHKRNVAGMIQDIFETVYIHRYKDTDSKIRSECAVALGDWVVNLPDVFFDGNYIKYLGWLLSDVASPARLQAIRSVARLYTQEAYVGGLRDFTDHFKLRMRQIAECDVDANVRVAAVRLLESVRNRGFLEPMETLEISRLIFSADERVRRSIVPFVAATVDEDLEEIRDDLGMEDSHEKHDWLRLKCLCAKLGEIEDSLTVKEDGKDNDNSVNDRITLAGKALWEEADMSRNWESIAKYLLHDFSGLETQSRRTKEEIILDSLNLGEREELIMLRLLQGSVAAASAAGGLKPADKKTKLTTHGDFEISLSKSLIEYLPSLLRKYSPNPQSATVALQLERFIDVGIYQQLRRDDDYGRLLDQISAQYTQHTDTRVLHEASASLLNAQMNQEMTAITRPKLSELQGNVVSTLKRTLRDMDMDRKLSPTNMNKVTQAVIRVEHLSSVMDVTSEIDDISDDLCGRDLLIRLASRNFDEPELSAHVVKTLMWYMIWKIAAVRDITSTESEKEDLQDVWSRLQLCLSEIVRERILEDAGKLTVSGVLNLLIHRLL